MQLLNLVTGNLDRPGGVMLTRPAVDAVGPRARRHAATTTCGAAGSAACRSSAGELPVATLADEILTPGEGQVRALLTVAGNPVSSTPDGKRLGEAIAGLDFVAAVDIYVNETTRHADVILPPTSALERDHYDLVFHALAVRNTARFTPALFDKPTGSLHDWEIYREIVLRTQRRLRGARRPLKRRLVQQARMRVSPTRTIDLLLRTGTARLSVAAARAPARSTSAPLEPCLPERLMTPDKRVRGRAAAGARRPGPARRGRPAHADGLLLVGRRHQRDNNSWMHNSPRLTKGRARHQLSCTPTTWLRAGIADGSVVRIASAVGEVEVEVQASDGHDAGRGEPAARLRPPAARRAAARTPSGCRARR